MDKYQYMVCVRCMTYNQESYIKDALNGFVMQQTDFPFIVVVVDDCSTDNTAGIVRAYEKEYPHIIKGVYLTENYYSQHKSKQVFLDPYEKRSKYIALCEGDDYWTDPRKLQKQVDFLESHDDYVLCCSAFTVTNEGHEEEPFVIHDANDKDEITLDDVLCEYWIGTLTTVFRSDLIADYEPPFPLFPMGDLQLWGFLATKGKIGYLSDVTANYRSLIASASHFSDLKKHDQFLLESMCIREYYAREHDRLSVVTPIFRKKAHSIFEDCYKNGWLDFPKETLWHFVKEYGHPSAYDKLKYWGLKSAVNYKLSNRLLHCLQKAPEDKLC